MVTIPFHVSESGPDVAVEDGLVLAGTIIASRYRVLEPLGSGGMGAVYLGEHLSVGRKVAIKVLHTEWSKMPAVSARFEAEARTASAIGHPGIVDVLDAGTLPDGRLYLVMEHLDGRDLERELLESGPIDPIRACRLMRSVAKAIAAAHKAGVVHRDLKPDNIIVLTRAGEEIVKVLDFGIAANRHPTRFNVATTAPGTMIGTPEHMPPEQAIGDEVGPHFDIYALGSVLFTLIDGEPPFVEENSLRLLARKQSEVAPALSDRVDGLPLALVELVADSLSVDIDMRPGSADEFLQRLDEALAELDPESVPPTASASFHASASASVSAGAGVATRTAPYTSLLPTPVSSPHLETGRSRLRPGYLVLAATLAFAALALFWEPLTRRTLADPAPDRSSEASVVDEVTEDDGGELRRTIPEAATSTRPEPRPNPAEVTPTPTDAGESDTTLPTGPDRPEAIDASTKPAKKPESRPTARTAEHLTPRCEQVREQTRIARDAYRWSTVLQLASQRRCWARNADARKIETQARMETGDFAGCVAASTGLNDAEVNRWRDLCRKRGGLG